MAYTTSKAVTMTPFIHGALVTKQPLNLRSNIKVNIFDHRINLYNRKSITIIPHVPMYYIIQYNLIFTTLYMHAFINSSFSLSYY